MGQITRDIYNNCVGEHIFSNLENIEHPKADIYLLHCFKNPKHFQNFILFKKPYKNSKVISLIHSSEPCMPAKCSDRVVTISDSWKKRLERLYNIKSKMIYGSLNVDEFNCNIDYNNHNFGKITRPEAGKYHNDWNQTVINVFNSIPDSHCYIASNEYKKLDYLKHDKMHWIEGINIEENYKKIKFLENISVHADAHSVNSNVFVDTFCVVLLECMAAGLANIIIGKYQPAMVELLGNTGIVCNDIKEFEYELIKLLKDPERKRELGLKAKERAKLFNQEKMINEYNKLFLELIK